MRVRGAHERLVSAGPLLRTDPRDVGCAEATELLNVYVELAADAGAAREGIPRTALQRRETMCHHQPRCPRWQAPDHLAARIVADQSGQGWSLLCNGVIVFDDGGELLRDGRALAPDRTVLGEALDMAA